MSFLWAPHEPNLPQYTCHKIYLRHMNFKLQFLRLTISLFAGDDSADMVREATEWNDSSLKPFFMRETNSFFHRRIWLCRFALPSPLTCFLFCHLTFSLASPDNFSSRLLINPFFLHSVLSSSAEGKARQKKSYVDIENDKCLPMDF